MALLFMDGFDHIGGGTNPAASTIAKWGASSFTPSAETGTVRTGTHALHFNTTSPNITSKAYATSGGFVVGFAVRYTTASFAANDLIQILENTTVHMAVGVTAGGLLTVKVGTTVLATGTTVLVASTWYYIEFKGVIHDTTGSYELRVSGVTELSNAGPIDTRNGGATGVWDRIRIAGTSNNQTYVDDLYLCDLSGSAPRNNFLGSVKVEVLYPQTDAVDAGSNAGLTCSTGTDHGALVDETSPNTTDYNSSATVGLKDTYEYPAMTLTGTVYGVQTNLYVAKSDAAVRQVCAVVRTASVDNDGANISPLTSFNYFTEIWSQDPNAGAPIEWTVANIATLQAGMKVTA